MNRKHIMIGLVIGGLLTYLVSGAIVNKRLENLRTTLDTDIEAQVTTLQEVAATLGRGGSTSEIDSFVKECPPYEMTQYDTLLSALDKGLNKVQLTELYSLFNRCGDTAASRRAGMTLLLEKEVEMLKQLVSERNLLGETEHIIPISDWQLLVEKEKEISGLFFELVSAQEEILVALMENVSPSSLLIENIRSRSQSVREELSVVTGDVSSLRAALTKS